jgi:hypothetical protein
MGPNDSTSVSTPEKRAEESVHVYFCDGTVQLFEADRIQLRDETIVLLDEHGSTVGRFHSSTVYMCTRRPSNALPF